MTTIKKVSVPIWGLFNLTGPIREGHLATMESVVSVPIWGLFNLTKGD